MEKITRRSFIKQSTTVAAGISVAAALPSSAWARPAGANNDIRIAVVGLGGRRVPWWAAALSIFSTHQSAVTFMGIPLQKSVAPGGVLNRG
jgi:hypothetical protein